MSPNTAITQTTPPLLERFIGAMYLSFAEPENCPTETLPRFEKHTTKHRRFPSKTSMVSFATLKSLQLYAAMISHNAVHTTKHVNNTNET